MYLIWPTHTLSIPRQILACSDTSRKTQDLQVGLRNSVFTAPYGVCSYFLIFSKLLPMIFNNVLAQCPALTGLKGTCKHFLT